MSNIIKATFADGERRATTEALYQWDYGQVLEIDGLELPHNFEVHFGNSGSTTTVTQIATDGVVTIPDAVLTVGKSVDVFIYLHTGQSDGETEYRIVIPVRARQQPTHETPTPVQQSEIEEAIAALESVAYNPVESGTGQFSVKQKTGTGDENVASGNHAAAFGLLNVASGAGATTFGSYNEATGACAFASGSRVSGQSGQVASGAASTVIGGSNNATANYATAIGRQNTASAQGATAIGMRGTASGGGSAVIGGLDNVASGTYAAVVGGSGNTASANYALATGYKTIANGRASAVFGQCNVEDDSPVNSEHGAGARNLLFIVGNGNDADHRSNAMTLDWDGNATLAGKMTLGADPTSNMDAATKKYVDDAVGGGGGTGLTEEIKQALLQIAQKVVYIDAHGQDYYDDLYDALYPATSYTVTNTLTHCTNSNAATSVDSGSSYTATISAESGYVLSSVTVTMGGTDVTSTVYFNGSISIASVSGDIAITATAIAQATSYTVTNTLTGCTTSNNATTITENTSYSATISASSGYTLTGATVSVTMGSTDITSSAYNNGTISIASVTGNLVISVAAVVIPVYTVSNTLTGCSSNNAATSAVSGSSYSATITASSNYSLTGATVSITMGGTDITSTAYNAGTISIASVTGNVSITVTAVAVVLSSISAVYTQSGTVYASDTLDSLTNDLVVTATYSDSTTAIISYPNYSLSGTLTVGTSTVTVTYGGKTDTFSVIVSAATYTVENTLTGCTSNNASTTAAGGSSYSAVITASSGYTLTGAIVHVAMGNADITSTAYNAGAISIASVTGNIVITVLAPVFEIANETFNGTSDYFDTGFKLFDSDKSFTVFVDYTAGTFAQDSPILHCVHEANPYPGFFIGERRNWNNVECFRHSFYSSGNASYFNEFDTNRHKYLVKHIAGEESAAVFYFDSATPSSAFGESHVTWQTINENLLVGCYQKTDGTKGRYWSGTVHDCRVWDAGLSQTDIANLMA